MGQLRRAKKDKHLYILPGQSQGTWQIHEEGEKWLQRENYVIPHSGEGVALDGGTYRYLKAKGYLYKHNIPYEEHDSSIYLESETTPVGLPLLLQLQEEQHPTWILMADMSNLAEDEKVWNELRRSQATSVTLSTALSSLQWKRLLNEFHLLKIWPQAQPYRIYWLRDSGKNGRHILQAASETPRLLDNWQGNVFAASTQRTNLWCRCLPGSTISFTGSILWLAKNDCKPEWPGKALAVKREDLGWPQELGWQLWQLEMQDSTPVSWEKVAGWFSYRSITITQHRQGLHIISPPGAITNDGQFISALGQPLYIQCDPPRQQVSGIVRQVYLFVTRVNNDPSTFKEPLPEHLEPVPTDQVSYFSWLTQRSGRYLIELLGDVNAEPLHIQVNAKPLACPEWLRGLSCTVSSPQKQQIFHAFMDSRYPEQNEKKDGLNCFSLQELSSVTWSFEPSSLPIHVSWNRDSKELIQSGEELTTRWQKYIWPSIATTTKAKITLDAGSFGLIELAIDPHKEDMAWWTDTHLLTQVIWLSRAATREHDQPQRTVPQPLRKAISQLRNQTVEHFLLYNAFHRLATTPMMPAWVLFRLHILITEIQQRQRDTTERSPIQ